MKLELDKMDNFKRMLTTERIERLKEAAVDKGIAPAVTNTVVNILSQLEIDGEQSIKLTIEDEEKHFNMFEALSTVLMAIPAAVDFKNNTQGPDNKKITDDSKLPKLSKDSVAQAKEYANKIGLETDTDPKTNPYIKTADLN